MLGQHYRLLQLGLLLALPQRHPVQQVLLAHDDHLLFFLILGQVQVQPGYLGPRLDEQLLQHLAVYVEDGDESLVGDVVELEERDIEEAVVAADG